TGTPLSAGYSEAIGSLTDGATTPLAIQTETAKEDIDLAGTPLAGHERLLRDKSTGKKVLARGNRKMVGERANEWGVTVPVWGPIATSLLAWDEGTEDTSIGVLRREAGNAAGVYLLEIKVGTPPDDNDAGSFTADFTTRTGDISGLF